jgi:hypothetical protein
MLGKAAFRNAGKTWLRLPPPEKGSTKPERHRQDPPNSIMVRWRKCRYDGSHPAVMADWIARMDWQDKLQYKGKSRVKHHHDKFKYRLLTFIEQKILGGRQIGALKTIS